MPDWSLRPLMYIVRGSSMEPSLFDGDVLLVRRLRRGPRHGDVVIVNASKATDSGWQVKRIVGVAGDRVSLEGGLLYINGQHHPEPYLNGLPADLGTRTRSWLVGTDECMVFGDNRAHSTDSRDWGPIPLARLAGVAVVRLWPIINRRPVRLR